MRLVKLQFNGYKRLANTNCNVDGKLVAFLGPNEAGKSSVLEALSWLTAQESTPLPFAARSRTRDVADNSYVVQAAFVLDDADQAELRAVGLTEAPQKFWLSKSVRGTTSRWLPSPVSWQAELFEHGVTALGAVVDDAAWKNTPGSAIPDGFTENFNEVVDLLFDARDRQWTKGERAQAATLATQLAELSWDADDDTSAEERAAQVTETIAPLCAAASTALKSIVALTARSPVTLAYDTLQKRAPSFVLFGAAERTLRTTYDLADEQLRASPPAALGNLLRVGETSVEELWAVLRTQDVTRFRTRLRRINEKLHQRLRPTWRQSELTVELATEGTTVQLLIRELHSDGVTTAIEERSDGLRMFIALVCFLYQRDDAGPSILLIDEAETHLHSDAQADLIDVLLRQQEAQQVLYTTHSPACLPHDLGTGVRFVRPSETVRDTSELENGFWHDGKPGFESLLARMGARVAAFSACRRAVLAEGPTEMLLLPTLIRLATGVPELHYQVTFGLANAAATSAALHDVASRVAYLVDGDAGGTAKKKELVKAGIAEKIVLTLPRGKAIEDLLTPQCYLLAVNAHLTESGYTGEAMTTTDLVAGKKFSSSVAAWCGERSLRVPGKPALASWLVANNDVIELQPKSAAALEELHGDLTAILEV